MIKKIKVNIDVIFFKEDGKVIAYSPALDLSAYGSSLKDAQKSFDSVFKIYIEETDKKGTLIEDLLKHGWTIQTNPVPVFTPPKMEKKLYKSLDVLKEHKQSLSLAC